MADVIHAEAVSDLHATRQNDICYFSLSVILINYVVLGAQHQNSALKCAVGYHLQSMYLLLLTLSQKWRGKLYNLYSGAVLI